MRMGAAALLACLVAGCSMPLHMDSLFDSKKTDVTGSIGNAAQAQASADLPPETDLVFTRRAVSEVMSRGQKDASVPWENPASGARGTVTALAASYAVDNAECRDFLASHVKASKEFVAARRSVQARQRSVGSARLQALDSFIARLALHKRQVPPY